MAEDLSPPAPPDASKYDCTRASPGRARSEVAASRCVTGRLGQEILDKS